MKLGIIECSPSAKHFEFGVLLVDGADPLGRVIRFQRFADRKLDEMLDKRLAFLDVLRIRVREETAVDVLLNPPIGWRLLFGEHRRFVVFSSEFSRLRVLRAFWSSASLHSSNVRFWN